MRATLPDLSAIPELQQEQTMALTIGAATRVQLWWPLRGTQTVCAVLLVCTPSSINVMVEGHL